jgi:hypothetical protein
MAGAAHLRAAQNPNTRRGGITFTSTFISQTPTGSTIRVTNNAGGQMRTTNIRAPHHHGENAALIDRMILQMLMSNAVQQGATNVEHMTYEELLQRFGVGTENRRGASRETIDALPLVTLDSVEAIEALTENQKTCNICLEDFQKGDKMRKLDCSHTFHQGCIDQWLAQVSSCPICKKEIQPTTTTSS